MALELGIILAFAAMLCWGFGDFLIQKSTRKLGDWETLFIITLVGAVFLLPFVYKDIPSLFSSWKSLGILLLASFILFIASLLDFEALKEGKLSVVEPLWSLEVPVSATLAFFIMKESISFNQALLIGALIVGLILVSLRSYHFTKRIWLEKATFIALAAAIVMGAANFFVGFGARQTDALMMNWFLSVFIMLCSAIYLVKMGSMKKMFRDTIKYRKLVLPMTIVDNLAWIAFAFAMILAPIAIAVAISESYIIVAVLLGMFVNKEFLRTHQKIGLVLALVAAITLAATLG
ncbi:MAG TPA: DMT family transporter [Candidatus Nanoarchaeia archaeon]|nr:DMT family transporter [Candidatus Nanoarchaeia archaeon]